MIENFGNKLSDFLELQLAEQGNRTPFRGYNMVSFLVKFLKFIVLIRNRGRPIQCARSESRKRRDDKALTIIADMKRISQEI